MGDDVGAHLLYYSPNNTHVAHFYHSYNNCPSLSKLTILIKLNLTSHFLGNKHFYRHYIKQMR